MAARKYKNHRKVIDRLRDDFKSGGNDFVLLYAYNGTGKTRLSMEFKEVGKRKEVKTETHFILMLLQKIYFTGIMI